MINHYFHTGPTKPIIAGGSPELPATTKAREQPHLAQNTGTRVSRGTARLRESKQAAELKVVHEQLAKELAFFLAQIHPPTDLTWCRHCQAAHHDGDCRKAKRIVRLAHAEKPFGLALYEHALAEFNAADEKIAALPSCFHIPLAEPMTMEERMNAIVAAGRHPAVKLFLDWECAGRLTIMDLNELLRDIWTGSDCPQYLVPKDVWLPLFRKVGIISDIPGKGRPTGNLTVFRGCIPGSERRMCWTLEKRVAKDFAPQMGGRVYTASIPSAGVLAYFENERNEREVVVDLGLLRNVRLVSY